MLSRESVLHLQSKVSELARAFDDQVVSDLGLPASKRLGCSLYLAFRPWEFSRFGELRKPGSEKRF